MSSKNPFLKLALLVVLGGVGPATYGAARDRFTTEARPLLETFCFECHNAEKHKGDLDLSRFSSSRDVFKESKVWEGVVEQLLVGEMPPKDHPQPTAQERDRLLQRITQTLQEGARAVAGDPGPVVLRRLNNAEYTWTIQDLTGVVSIDPAREFPADSAGGEGFMNTGQVLVMSPALLTKYLDAAKSVASHAVLLPDGIRFSPSDSSRDWTDEALARIRSFYQDHGIEVADAAGRIPLEPYLKATLTERRALKSGPKSLRRVAEARHLNPRYLAALWNTLQGGKDTPTSPILDPIRARWRGASESDAKALASEIAQWQTALWRFNPVGHLRRHLGGTDGPTAWMEPVNPVSSQREVRIRLTPATNAEEVVVYLAATQLGDGTGHDVIRWREPHLVIPGRPRLALRDVRDLVHQMGQRRDTVFRSAAACLAAAAEVALQPEADLGPIASRHGITPDLLRPWLDHLGLGVTAALRLDRMTGRLDATGGYEFVKGWGSPETPSVVANSSDQALRIPGNLGPLGVAVHPSPTLNVAVGWRSPVADTVRIEATVTHAHPECGNGVTWSLELRRGSVRQRLATGVAQGGKPVAVPVTEALDVRPGDVLSLLVGPRDGNHSCDLTDVRFKISGARTWDLSQDVAPSILAGNPHADGFGNPEVWHFYTEPVSGNGGTVIPAQSLLARWQSTSKEADKTTLAAALQNLLVSGPSTNTPAPDVQLYRQLASLGGPLFASVQGSVTSTRTGTTTSRWGLDPALFGKGTAGSPAGETDLVVSAPSRLEIHLPADLVAGCEFVTIGELDPVLGRAGTVQLFAQTTPPPGSGLDPNTGFLVGSDAATRERLERSLDAFRDLFPAALCYHRIVPVDEAVTLTLYHREDGPLKRLFLSDAESAELDRLWDELFFISREPVLLQSAFEQIYEYATQDRPDMVKAFTPMREPIRQRTAAFREREVAAEPRQLEAVLRFAGKAYRRPPTQEETQELQGLYATLRSREIPHPEALRLTLAKVLVSPAFLYRIEQPAPGTRPAPVSAWELATRLSYFLWSSTPDDELLALARSGDLLKPDVLARQARRMLQSPKIRRLAEEFGCAWLHLHGFTTLDEKSERHFPEFAALRGPMYEESVRTFIDLFQNNRPIPSLLSADHTFLNDSLAKHYGIPDVVGPEWRRVDGVKAHGRGGILAQAAVLSKQSGASRTSPILRGNWLCETVLGEKLPRPPKGVPVLPEEPPTGLSERQLTEQHSRDPKCAGCHARMDPYGYSLEAYDAIGRHRTTDTAGRPIDTRAQLADRAEFDGLDGLRLYLLTQKRDAFVRQVERKLLGYALGRSVQLSDEPLLRTLSERLRHRDHPIAEVLELIVRSPQFREIRGRDSLAQD